eukprot:scaffold2281_cov43-Cyclotella_meneghiniana.AAC.5
MLLRSPTARWKNHLTKIHIGEEDDIVDLKHHKTYYCKFSASTFTADQGLKVLQWSSWAVSYLTKSNRSNKHLSESLQKLSREISMARHSLRLYGFFQFLEKYRNGLKASGDWENPLISKIEKYVMAASMLFYHPLEHLAYAGWQMPKLVKVDANRYSAMSNLFLTSYIVGDFWTSCLRLAEFKKKLSILDEILTEMKAGDKNKSGQRILEQQQLLLGKVRLVKLQILCCLLLFLPSINWSIQNWTAGLLISEQTTNGLMLAESYTSVYQSLCGMLG